MCIGTASDARIEWPRVACVVALAAQGIALTNLPARAQGLNMAGAAPTLAQRALAALIRGEDAPTPTAQLEEYRQGLALAQRAVAADERNADAQFALSANLARVALLEGHPPNPVRLLQAQRALDAALALNPHHADALAARGGLYRQLPWWLGRNLAKAADDLRQAVQLDPDNVGARIELALTYRDLGEPQRGVPLLEAAVAVAERRQRPRKAAEARRLLAELTSTNANKPGPAQHASPQPTDPL